MTLPATPRRAGPFSGDDAATSFPFSFKTYDKADVEVLRTGVDGVEVELVLDSDYSVALNVDQDVSPGGAVLYPIVGAPLPTGATLAIVGDLPYDQVTDLPTGGAYRAEVVENTFDRIVMQIQQLAELASRAITVSPGTDVDNVSTQLPPPEAFHVIGWNEDEDALVNYDPADFATLVVAGSATADLFDGDGVTTTFTLSQMPGTSANLDVSIGGVVQRPGIDYTVASGSQDLVFTVAPIAGVDNVLARYVIAIPPQAPEDLRDDLADAVDLTKGDALVAVHQPFPGAVARTQHDKNRESVTVDDFMPAPGADATAPFQAALDAGPTIVRFVGGKTYNLTGDIAVPARRKIIVEAGAVVINTGGRFTAYDVTDVEWQIDGHVRSVGMLPAPQLIGWPTDQQGAVITPERGFIEFGGTSAGVGIRAGWKVHGTGKVSADWVGTPNFSDSTQVNRKGIAAWHAANVLVEGLEVYGFEGEAIYSYGTHEDCVDWTFRRNYVHDSRFNALNFNAAGPYKGLLICDNTAYNVFCGVESSVGSIMRNHVDLCPASNSCGIWTGSGGGNGPIRISDNIVSRVTQHSYAASYNALRQNVVVVNNISIDPGQYAVFGSFIENFLIAGNLSVGHGRLVAATAYAVANSKEGLLLDNVAMKTGAAGLAKAFAVFAGNVDVLAQNNQYIAAAGAAGVAVRPLPVLPSAATVVLPSEENACYQISGVAAITDITPKLDGLEVTFLFWTTAQVLTGAGLRLDSDKGTFNTAFGSTISFVHLGGTWYEKGRSH
jgi:hypothetical protein